ncbi:MAG TPA: hypothetical protein VGB69_06025 [Edaphobacter sp.]
MIEPSGIAAFVLSGGRSSRMGREASLTEASVLHPICGSRI